CRMNVTLPTVQDVVKTLIEKNEDKFKTIDFVVGMSRGGLIPAALIATKLNKPLVAIYINKQDEIFLDRIQWLKGKEILLVDDVCRTGSTLRRAVVHIERNV